MFYLINNMDVSTFPKDIEITDDYVKAVKQVKKDFIEAAKEKKKQHMQNPNYEGPADSSLNF